eukprot:3516203-Pyramimonas_sp.AAC.1
MSSRTSRSHIEHADVEGVVFRNRRGLAEVGDAGVAMSSRSRTSVVLGQHTRHQEKRIFREVPDVAEQEDRRGNTVPAGSGRNQALHGGALSDGGSGDREEKEAVTGI